MCTVSFVPFTTGNFILTQNRDEGYERSYSLMPQVYKNSNKLLLYPKDPVGNGTWIATSSNGLTACLLNGAFEKHKRNLPYSKSRGLILLDLFKFDHVSDFIKKYSLNNIEPFTIIAIDGNKEGYELIWDENKLHCTKFNTTEHQIWSSSTLYTPEQKKQRHQWYFNKVKEDQLKNQNDILDFHLLTDISNLDNSILMQREKVGTVSVTSIHVSEQNTEMTYVDVISKEERKVSLIDSVINN